jgi:hypothetical protein
MRFYVQGGIFDAPEPSGRIRPIQHYPEEDELDDDVPKEEPIERRCIPTWIGARHSDLDGEYWTCHETKVGFLWIDFFPRTLPAENVCYRWVSAFTPKVISDDLIRHRVISQEWKWWYIFILPLALLDRALNVDIWWEHRVCARVGNYYDTNCGLRLLTEIRCQSSWVQTRDSGSGSVKPPGYGSSQGVPPDKIPEDGPPEDVYPEPPDDEPVDEWERAEIMAWDWIYSCKPYNFAFATSWKWLDDVKYMISVDPDLKLDRIVPWMDGGTQKSMVFDGSCVTGGIAYAWKVYYFKRKI